MYVESYDYVAKYEDAAIMLRIASDYSGLMVYTRERSYAISEPFHAAHPWPHGIRALVRFQNALNEHAPTDEQAREDIRAAARGAARSTPLACGVDWIDMTQRAAAVLGYMTLAASATSDG